MWVWMIEFLYGTEELGNHLGFTIKKIVQNNFIKRSSANMFRCHVWMGHGSPLYVTQEMWGLKEFDQTDLNRYPNLT